EVPEYVLGILEDAEGYASGIAVIKVPQRSVVNELAVVPHRAAEQKRVIHHDLEPCPLRQFDELLLLLRSRCTRLFDENILAIQQGGFRKFEVRPDRSDDGNRVNLWGCHNLGKVGSQVHTRVNPVCTLECA